MNGGANFYLRASVLLMLSCAVCAELGTSESHSTIRVFNRKYDVPSTLGSVSVRHSVRLNDKYQTFARHRMINKRLSKKFRRSNRNPKTNMKGMKMAVLGKPAKSMDRVESSGKENQFTFTSPDSRGLVIQVKPFVRTQGIGGLARSAVSYKVYVLEGLNIRHFRISFPSGRRAIAAFDERRRVANCIRRRYLKRCIDRPLRKKGSCTTRIVKKCVPGFLVFQDASSATLGTNRDSPLPSPAAIVSPSPEPDMPELLDSTDDAISSSRKN